jgi:hypothetical protein
MKLRLGTSGGGPELWPWTPAGTAGFYESRSSTTFSSRALPA